MTNFAESPAGDSATKDKVKRKKDNAVVYGYIVVD
jgi:hypothetical protein